MNKIDQDDAYSLGVLEAIGERSDVSQRRLAQRLGVALGLVNSYLKRCVRKGWVKVQQVPGNRYLYYLTPKGFVEKSRLSANYLSSSLAFYRKAGASCLEAYELCRSRGWKRIALCGVSEFAEIAFLRSQEQELVVEAFIDFNKGVSRFLGRPVYSAIEDLESSVDGFVLTALDSPAAIYDRLSAVVGEDNVIVPGILEWRPGKNKQ